MKCSISVLTSPQELKNYFGKGEVWKKALWSDDGAFDGESDSFLVQFKPSHIEYKVDIYAIDDPTDSEEIITTNPTKELVKFLSNGVPGGEHLERAATSPSEFAQLLRYLSEEEPSSNVLRRVAILPDQRLTRQVLARVVSLATDTQDAELDKIKEEMKRKGWKVWTDIENNHTQLHVDISGIYEATIAVEQCLYEYKFSLRDRSDIEDSGTTDDPIKSFKKFYRDEKVEESRKDAQHERKEKAREQDDVKTVAPPPKRKYVEEIPA
jgi:hypothetical protein